MSKIPGSAVNYGLLAKFSSFSVSRAGRCGVLLEMTEGNYSNVGHRGPVYKGLGAMNPYDNLTVLTKNMVCLQVIYFQEMTQSKMAETGLAVPSCNNGTANPVLDKFPLQCVS
jgi:hypothetical protein